MFTEAADEAEAVGVFVFLLTTTPFNTFFGSFLATGRGFKGGAGSATRPIIGGGLLAALARAATALSRGLKSRTWAGRTRSILFETPYFLAVFFFTLTLLFFLSFSDRIEKHNFILFQSSELVGYKVISLAGKRNSAQRIFPTELGLFFPFFLFCDLLEVERLESMRRGTDVPDLQQVSMR